MLIFWKRNVSAHECPDAHLWCNTQSFGATMGSGCWSNLGTCEVRDTPRLVSSSFPEPTVVVISPCWTSSSSPVPSLQASVLSPGPVWSPSQRSQLQKRHSVSLASCQWWGSDRGSGCRCRTPLWPHLGRPRDSGPWENSAAKPWDREWKHYLSCQGQSRGPHEGRSERLDIEFTCGGMNVQQCPFKRMTLGIAPPSSYFYNQIKYQWKLQMR